MRDGTYNDQAKRGPIHESHSLDILLVEDSPADAGIIRTILRDARPDCRLHVVADAIAAFDFLYRRSSFAKAPVPHIIVLDWYLPRHSGDEVLTAIKSDPELCTIPVIVLSSSQLDEEVVRGYELQASCWVVKGSDLEEEGRRLRAMLDFWASTAELPRPAFGRPRSL